VRAEIVGVGTELLLGQITNTNARWMSERLAEVGVDVLYHSVVGDNPVRIASTLRLAMERVDVVVVTGGLGPTGDDITRDVLAQVLDVPLVRHPELERFLRERFAEFGLPMPESNLRQADVPEGVRYVRPERGTAPGLIAEGPDHVRVYAMAGVPAEMREFMEGTVLPELSALAGPAVVRSRVIRCTGMGESAVAERLEDLFEASANPSIAYLADIGEVRVRVTAKAETAEEADAALAPLLARVTERLGDVVVSTDGATVEQAVARLLRDADSTLACAESLTGGRLAARLTEAPGSSATFRGSAVVYTPESKRDLLGVRRETLSGPGVVSEACALEMAAGARRIFEADFALAVTGVAGPDPHDGEPPGSVWVALAGPGIAHARHLQLPGERDRITRWAELAALDLLRRHLAGLPLPARERA
jgi:nicotinamide-nucleotide amidase